LHNKSFDVYLLVFTKNYPLIELSNKEAQIQVFDDKISMYIEDYANGLNI